jgi:hypothetical protein
VRVIIVDYRLFDRRRARTETGLPILGRHNEFLEKMKMPSNAIAPAATAIL